MATVTKRTRATIARLLSNIGGRKEVDQYLRHYSGVDSHKFAVIKIGGGILDDALQSLAASLSFLHEVGLYPILVHGFGPRAQRALDAAGLDAPLVDGRRVMTAEAFDVVRQVYRSEGLALAQALVEHGCGAQPMPADVLTANRCDAQRFGLTADAPRVNEAPIALALRASQLPVVASLAVDPAGQLLSVDGDEVAAALAKHFKPHKIIFLTRAQGVRGANNRLIEAVNLSEDYRALVAADSGMSAAMRQFLMMTNTLLQALPEAASISVTSPEHLARELFTHRGAGTLIRRGTQVRVWRNFSNIDTGRLRELLQSCFERTLSHDYFEKKRCHRVYLTDDYRATAIVTHEAGVPYLDKFAVTAKAQGEGLGSSLWARMRRDHAQLYWRARRNNRINNWYFQQADGSFKNERWVVFWYGIDSFATIERCVKTALSMPATLLCS